MFYCGRRIGRLNLKYSDGRCGPNGGPQCEVCIEYSEKIKLERERAAKGIKETPKTAGQEYSDFTADSATGPTEVVLAKVTDLQLLSISLLEALVMGLEVNSGTFFVFVFVFAFLLFPARQCCAMCS